MAVGDSDYVPLLSGDLPLKSEERKREGAKAESRAPEGDAAAAPEIGLKHGSLSFWAGVSLGCGDIIGSGIFASPGVVLDYSGSILGAIFAWILGGLVSIVGVLLVIELGTARPSAGGLYTYLALAYGDAVAFSWQYVNFVCIVPGSLAALALTFGCYFSELLSSGGDLGGGAGMQEKLLGWASLLLVTGVNCAAPNLGTALSQLFLACTLASCIFVIVLGVVFIGQGRALLENFEPGDITEGTNWGKMGPAFMAALWAFSGWADLGVLSEEIENPRKNMPRVGIATVGAITLSYVLMNLAYLLVVDKEEMKASKALGVEFAKQVGGEWAGYAMTACVCIASCGGLLNCMFLSCRQFYATAREGQFPAVLAKLTSKGSPYVAVLATSAWTAVLMLPADFSAAINYVGFALWVYYGALGPIVITLRRMYPDHELPFKAPGSPWLPLFFFFICLYISISTFVDSPLPCALSLVFLLSAFPVYHVCFVLLPKRWKALPDEDAEEQAEGSMYSPAA